MQSMLTITFICVKGILAKQYDLKQIFIKFQRNGQMERGTADKLPCDLVNNKKKKAKEIKVTYI